MRVCVQVEAMLVCVVMEYYEMGDLGAALQVQRECRQSVEELVCWESWWVGGAGGWSWQVELAGGRGWWVGGAGGWSWQVGGAGGWEELVDRRSWWVGDGFHLCVCVCACVRACV